MGDRAIKPRAFVLDTSSVINGYVTDSGNHYTVPEVVDEARGLAASATIGVSIELGHLRVLEASSSSVASVKKRLAEIGGELSDTDVKVIALALDLRREGLEPVILTDDYGLQNLSRVLRIEYSSIATRGIRSVFQWKNVCPGCHREYPPGRRICPVCGTKLRRVVVRGSTSFSSPSSQRS